MSDPQLPTPNSQLQAYAGNWVALVGNDVAGVGESADIALLARELLRNPNWPFHAAQELGADTKKVLAKQHAHFVG